MPNLDSRDARGDSDQREASQQEPLETPSGIQSLQPLVVVTGSTGLIGGRLVDALTETYRVVGLDVKPPMVDSGQAEWLECDLTDDRSVAAAFEEIRRKHGDSIASVVHLAAYYDFAGEPSPLYEELTVEGTRRLLKQLQFFQVQQLIFSSSLLVMQPSETGEPITEQSPTEGVWDYPRSKLEAEAVLRQERGQIPTLVLRIAGVYDENGHSVPVVQQISRIYEKQLESYFFPGDADHGQAFIHLEDLIACFVTAIQRRHSLGSYEVLLVAEPDVMSYAELQDQIGEQLHGREWPTLRIPKVLAKAGAWARENVLGGDESFIKPWMVDLADTHYPVAIEKAQRLLHWQPRHRLRSTLGEMLRRLQADPDGWYKMNGLPLPGEEQEE